MNLTSLRAALAAMALAAPASAEPFTLFIYETPAELALRSDKGAAGAGYWQSYAAFANAATRAGILRGGSALRPEPEETVTLTAAGASGRDHATSDLALGGYFQIDVADRTAATEWAAKLPAASTGAVEVRSGFPAPAM